VEKLDIPGNGPQRMAASRIEANAALLEMAASRRVRFI
jgi:hypothetical protein